VRAEGTDSPKSNVQSPRSSGTAHKSPSPDSSELVAGRPARKKDPRRGPAGGDPFFTQREKKIPGAPGQVVPPGPAKSGPAVTGLSQLI